MSIFKQRPLVTPEVTTEMAGAVSVLRRNRRTNVFRLSGRSYLTSLLFDIQTQYYIQWLIPITSVLPIFLKKYYVVYFNHNP